MHVRKFCLKLYIPFSMLLTFPIDFRDIGIDDFILDSTSLDQLDTGEILEKINLIKPYNNRLQTYELTKKNIDTSGTTTITVFKPGFTITVDEIEYTVDRHLGNGTFGSVCSVVDSSGKKYALKEQKSEYYYYDFDDNAYHSMSYDEYCEDSFSVKEAMIHHIVYTIDPSFAAKIYKIFYSERSGVKLYILTELLKTDCHDYIRRTKFKDQDDALFSIFHGLHSRLERLNTDYSFTHGDLKASNIMIDSSGTLRLIDFGMSRIIMNDTSGSSPAILETSSYNINCNKSNDITLLSVTCYNSFIDDTLHVSMTPFIDGISRGYDENVNIADYELTGVTIDGTVIDTTVKLYKYCNRNENPKGTFDAIREFITSREPRNFHFHGGRVLMNSYTKRNKSVGFKTQKSNTQKSNTRRNNSKSLKNPSGVSAEYYIHSIPLKKHKLEQLETLCKRINYGELKLAAIRDIYFHVKNSLQALQLLRYLLFFPEPYDGKSVNFQKSIETFVERYKKYILSKGSVDDLTHTAMVPPILWNSKIL